MGQIKIETVAFFGVCRATYAENKVAVLAVSHFAYTEALVPAESRSTVRSIRHSFQRVIDALARM